MLGRRLRRRHEPDDAVPLRRRLGRRSTRPTPPTPPRPARPSRSSARASRPQGKLVIPNFGAWRDYRTDRQQLAAVRLRRHGGACSPSRARPRASATSSAATGTPSSRWLKETQAAGQALPRRQPLRAHRPGRRPLRLGDDAARRDRQRVLRAARATTPTRPGSPSTTTTSATPTAPRPSWRAASTAAPSSRGLVLVNPDQRERLRELRRPLPRLRSHRAHQHGDGAAHRPDPARRLGCGSGRGQAGRAGVPGGRRSGPRLHPRLAPTRRPPPRRPPPRRPSPSPATRAARCGSG